MYFIKRKDFTTMKNNENVNETLEAGVLIKRHSEGSRPKNPIYFLKRFFAKYKFPFAGNCVRPAQNDGKILVPQCPNNLVPFSPLSLPSPSVLLRSHKTGTAIAFHPLLACAGGEGSKNVTNLADFGKCGAVQDFCHSGSLEKYYEFTNSYFSCYSESVNDDENPIKLNRFRIKSGMTSPRKMQLIGTERKHCSCLSGMTEKNIKHLFTHSLINLFTSKKLVAFTLAEVLITLGIIGVVAAMTIPNLMFKYYEHQTVSRLLETQSILTQAFRSAEEELGEVSGWGITGQNVESAEIIGKNLKQYLKLATDCGISDKNGSCFPLMSKDKPDYKLLNGQNYFVNYALSSQRYKVSLLNGSSISFIVLADYTNTNGIQINIDTNGPAKPNVMGKDLFLFQYNSDDKSLVAMGAPSTIYPLSSHTCTKTSGGYGCAYYILQYKNMQYLK